MPKTPLQMLLRGQNLLGYRHYADDVVEAVERAVKTAWDVFRVFDAMNDPRNTCAPCRRSAATAPTPGTLSHHQPGPHPAPLDLTEQLLETGVDSVAIKDMSGILTPHAAFELVSEIKKRYDVTPAPALPRHHRDGGDGPAEGHWPGSTASIPHHLLDERPHPATEALVATPLARPTTPASISTG
ncbi:Methylmalonyl-CoA carboxyltransferase 5S subunit [Klebsiella pneumoniae]|nr:Methylmalonyl-CoA carboxyltransferase 5S subunit [Klebsiella pneumoniae]